MTTSQMGFQGLRASADRCKGIAASSPHPSGMCCSRLGNAGARSQVRDTQQMPPTSGKVLARGTEDAARAAFTSHPRRVGRTSNG